jgi:hypothetical protein
VLNHAGQNRAGAYIAWHVANEGNNILDNSETKA